MEPIHDNFWQKIKWKIRKKRNLGWENEQLRKSITELQNDLDYCKYAIANIAPWLAASLKNDSCEEYQQACNMIFELENKNYITSLKYMMEKANRCDNAEKLLREYPVIANHRIGCKCFNCKVGRYTGKIETGLFL